ncbi:MAG: hypothetical protein HYU57_04540 [Micavibrio aeruginosavorus]|nr:hypothetical protein [Micavibrio aeruginosavorus]
MSFLSRLWSGKQAPELTEDQKRELRIAAAVKFFDLPWDGAKRMQASPLSTVSDILEIQEYSTRDQADRQHYCAGLPIPSRTYWQHRIDHTKMVMAKLGYADQEIEQHARYLTTKHASHFHPNRVKRALG